MSIAGVCVFSMEGVLCFYTVFIVSAGVGRTGIFIVVDYSFQKLKQEKQVDIFNLVKELRTQRPFMVQTLVSLDLSLSYMVTVYCTK